MAFGRTILGGNSVSPTRVSADGSPVYKPGGVTIDWANTVTASGSAVTLPDGSAIEISTKYLRYGQVICRITTGTGQTFTSTATGGTFTYTFTRPDNGQSVTTAAIAYNATAATILAAIQAVAGPGQAVSATGGALNSAPVVVNFGDTVALGTVNNTLATGGTVVPTQTGTGTTGGFFGPYDSTASDGRQLLNRGDCFIVDQTTLQYSAGSTKLSVANDNIGGVIEGGLVFIDRVLQSGGAAHSLAAGPTLTELLAAFPRLSITKD